MALSAPTFNCTYGRTPSSSFERVESQAVTLTRPYTAEENATADAEAVEATQTANKSTIETNLEADLAAMQAIKDQTNADLRADPSQEIKDIATAVRRLIRMAIDDYSGTE